MRGRRERLADGVEDRSIGLDGAAGQEGLAGVESSAPFCHLRRRVAVEEIVRHNAVEGEGIRRAALAIGVDVSNGFCGAA